MQPRLLDDLTAQRLRELLHYDEATGVFRWKQSRGSRGKAGSVAGRLNTTGSRQIEIAGRAYLAGEIRHEGRSSRVLRDRKAVDA